MKKILLLLPLTILLSGCFDFAGHSKLNESSARHAIPVWVQNLLAGDS